MIVQVEDLEDIQAEEKGLWASTKSVWLQRRLSSSKVGSAQNLSSPRVVWEVSWDPSPAFRLILWSIIGDKNTISLSRLTY